MSMVGFNSHALQILVSNSCFHTWLQYLFSVLVFRTCVNTLCQYYRYADLLSPLWTGVAKPAILIIIDELCRSGFDRIVVVSYTPNTQVLNPIQSLTTLPCVLCSLSLLSQVVQESDRAHYHRLFKEPLTPQNYHRLTVEQVTTQAHSATILF